MSTETVIDMVLHCPKCGLQHIDAPESGRLISGGPFAGRVREGWSNPPHRSHLCHGCGYIWRPADVPTNGVAAVKTKGKADSPTPKAEPLTRYCPECGSVGEVPAPARDCCPDGMHARMVPKNFAESCRATFMLAIGGAT